MTPPTPGSADTDGAAGPHRGGLALGLVAAVTISARLFGASPRPAQAPATAATTESPLPASTCLAGGGVVIGVGDDAQSVVNGHGPGTTYIVKAGVHLRNFGVQPKTGDRYCGEPGAVLDGGRSLPSAFSGGASNVTLDSITVRDYNSGKLGGAIHPDPRASRWLVRNVSSLHNAGAGLLVADGMRILGGHYNDNDQLGIGGNEATGIVLDGLASDPTTLGTGRTWPATTCSTPLRLRERRHEVGLRAVHHPQRLRA